MVRLHDYSKDMNAVSRRVHWHEVVSTVPAVRASLKRAGRGPVGTADGWERRCSCGYATRSRAEMRAHIDVRNTELRAKHPLAPGPRHRLMGTERRADGLMLVCSCSSDFELTDGLRAHIEQRIFD